MPWGASSPRTMGTYCWLAIDSFIRYRYGVVSSRAEVESKHIPLPRDDMAPKTSSNDRAKKSSKGEALTGPGVVKSKNTDRGSKSKKNSKPRKPRTKACNHRSCYAKPECGHQCCGDSRELGFDEFAAGRARPEATAINGPRNGAALVAPSPPVEESGEEELLVLSEVAATTDCELKDEAKSKVRLTATLQVCEDRYQHRSRLGYHCRFHLQRDLKSNDEGERCAEITAWRIAKTTDAQPRASAPWIQELLAPAQSQIKKGLREATLCLKAMFPKDGAVRADKIQDDAIREKLVSDSLLFIELIVTLDGFQGQGLLTPMLSAYHQLLRILPEWFAFSGLSILVPGKPENFRSRYEKKSREEVEKDLTRAYSKRDFKLIANGEVEVKKGEFRAVPVMARVVPTLDEEQGDEKEEGQKDAAA